MATGRDVIFALLLVVTGSYTHAQCLDECHCIYPPYTWFGFNLDCRGRGLTAIPVVFNMSSPTESYDRSYDDIDEMSFAYNHIKILDANSFANFPTVNRKLVLSHNRISDIVYDVFAGYTVGSNYTHLDLSYNALSSFNFDILTNLPYLDFLGLSHNKIRNVHYFGINLKIRTLELNHNDIDHLPTGLFEGIAGLKEVDLSFNRLVQLPDMASTALIFLHLQNNSIWELDSSRFGDFENMDYLSFDNNQLTYIDQATAAVFKNAERYSLGISLSGNPWTCDCKLADIRNTWPEHPLLFPDTFVCQAPPKFKNRDFWYLNQSEICQPDGEDEDDDKDDDDDDEDADSRMTMILVVTIVASILATLVFVIVIAVIVDCCLRIRKKKQHRTKSVGGHDNAVPMD